MSDVKWIKLAVGLPDNRKIKQIRKLPEGDTIALMWIFLMCLAGETNEDGLIYFTPEIPYTDEMLADQFNMDVNTVRLALTSFQRFGMLEIIDDVIKLNAWERWQATDKLAEMREYNRIRKQEYRARKRLEKSVPNLSGTSPGTSPTCPHTDKIRQEDRQEDRLDERKEGENFDSPEKCPRKYGEFENVFLTDEEFAKLQEDFPNDYDAKIENLSSYIASTGKVYDNHFATIKNWAAKDEKETKQQTNAPQQNNKSANPFLELAKQEGLM